MLRLGLQLLVFVWCLLLVSVNGFQRPLPLSRSSYLSKRVQSKVYMCKKMDGRPVFLSALVFFHFVSNLSLYLGLGLGLKELEAMVKTHDTSKSPAQDPKRINIDKNDKFLLFLE